MTLARRSFLIGLAAAVAAPAIVRASALMPIKVMRIELSTRYFAVGDIVTFEGVEAWSRIQNVSLSALRQFVITASGPFNEAAIYPSIVPEGRYRTVVARPAELKPAILRRVPVWG